MTKVPTLPTAAIDIGSRLRPIDPAWVKFLAGSIEADGIRSPILVRASETPGRFLLVVGAHRLEAARQCGLKAVPVECRDGMTDDEARLCEIAENLYRYELSDLDRAVFLAEKKRLHEALYPHTTKGRYQRRETGADQVAKLFPYASTFTKEEAERLGITPRYVRRILTRAEIAPELRARLVGHPLSRNGSELDKLVKLDPDQQRDVIELLLSGAPDAPKTVAAAADKVSGRNKKFPLSDADEQWSGLQRAYRKASGAARERFMQEIANDPVTLAMIRDAVAQRDASASARR